MFCPDPFKRIEIEGVEKALLKLKSLDPSYFAQKNFEPYFKDHLFIPMDEAVQERIDADLSSRKSRQKQKFINSQVEKLFKKLLSPSHEDFHPKLILSLIRMCWENEVDAPPEFVIHAVATHLVVSKQTPSSSLFKKSGWSTPKSLSDGPLYKEPIYVYKSLMIIHALMQNVPLSLWNAFYQLQLLLSKLHKHWTRQYRLLKSESGYVNQKSQNVSMFLKKKEADCLAQYTPFFVAMVANYSGHLANRIEFHTSASPEVMNTEYVPELKSFRKLGLPPNQNLDVEGNFAISRSLDRFEGEDFKNLSFTAFTTKAIHTFKRVLSLGNEISELMMLVIADDEQNQQELASSPRGKTYRGHKQEKQKTLIDYIKHVAVSFFLTDLRGIHGLSTYILSLLICSLGAEKAKDYTLAYSRAFYGRRKLFKLISDISSKHIGVTVDASLLSIEEPSPKKFALFLNYAPTSYTHYKKLFQKHGYPKQSFWPTLARENEFICDAFGKRLLLHYEEQRLTKPEKKVERKRPPATSRPIRTNKPKSPPKTPPNRKSRPFRQEDERKAEADFDKDFLHFDAAWKEESLLDFNNESISDALSQFGNRKKKKSTPITAIPKKKRSEDFDFFSFNWDFTNVNEPKEIQTGKEPAIKPTKDPSPKKVEQKEPEKIVADPVPKPKLPKLEKKVDPKPDPDTEKESVDPLDFESLIWKDRIGIGGFAEVFCGEYCGTEVAIKQLMPERLNESLKEFKSEVAILSRLHHDNIVKYIGASFTPPKVVLVTELLEMSLFDLLHNTSIKLSWHLKYRITRGIVGGLHYIHTLTPPLVHRDLKSANVLLDKHFGARIADFGLSRDRATYVMTGQTGTFQWMSPEVIANEKYDEKADIFSLSIIIWELCMREIPYEGMNSVQVGVAVVTRKVRPEIVDELTPPPWKNLIIKCWDQDPANRPSTGDIIKLLDGPNFASYRKKAKKKKKV